MNANQLQSLNDLLRKHIWNLEDVSISRVESYWMVKIIADEEQFNYQIDRLGLVEDFQMEF